MALRPERRRPAYDMTSVKLQWSHLTSPRDYSLQSTIARKDSQCTTVTNDDSGQVEVRDERKTVRTAAKRDSRYPEPCR